MAMSGTGLQGADFPETARNLALWLRAALSQPARRILRETFHHALYLRTYPDVAASAWPPILHYLLYGHREMRDPGPAFSTAWYLRKNPDVLRAGVCPLLHYAVAGHREGRAIRHSSRFGPASESQDNESNREMDLWPAGQPLVSIVIPCFNYGHTLGRCLDSLARQTFRDFEVLVIEGGSTDPHSVVQLKELERENRPNTRFLYRSSPSLLGDNRNYGIAAAKGKYICCLDADDMLHPVYFETTVFTAEAQDFDVVSPSVRCFGDSRFEWQLHAPSLEKLMRGNCISVAALFRREVWEKTGGYRDWGRNADYLSEDWDFWIRALGLGFRATALAAPLHLYCVHEGGLSREGDHTSFRRKLVEANRGLLESPHPIRAGSCFANPLVNMRRRSVSPSPQGVLFFMPWITQGGAENHLRAIATALNKSRHSAAVITTADLPPAMPDETDRFERSGIVVYNLPDLIADAKLWPLFIEEVLYRHNIGTLFLCGSEYAYTLLPWLRGKSPALRIVDQLFNEEGHLSGNRSCAPLIDLTVVQSGALRDLLLQTYRESADRVRFIPQSLLPASEDEKELDRELIERMSGKFVISFIGRFAPEKCPAFFAQLALRLSARAEYFFLLVGDGPHRPQVLAKMSSLAGRFHAPGAVANPRAYIAHSNVLVLPSTLEGMPGVLLEALDADCAVVASRVGAIPEVIIDGINGFLCEPGDANAFFACVEKLRAEPVLLESVQRNAKATLRQRADFETVMCTYCEVLINPATPAV